MKKTFRILVFFFSLWIGFNLSAMAGTTEDADVIVEKSRAVVEEMMLSIDKNIPRYLIERSAGLVIIPDMLKGGFVLGGSYGKGVVVAYRDGVWSGPAFVYIGGGSVGFQIGIQSTDLILVVIGQETMQSFLKTRFKLGGDLAIAAGPLGAGATAAMEGNLKGGIYSYSRSKGLFAGISLEGAGMGTNFDLNRAYHNKTDNQQILYEEPAPHDSGKRLLESLGRLR